jgi:hypothetical protein
VLACLPPATLPVLQLLDYATPQITEPPRALSQTASSHSVQPHTHPWSAFNSLHLHVKCSVSCEHVLVR